MADTFTAGTLVRFTRKVTRHIRDIYFNQTERTHEVSYGTVGIVLGTVTGNWSRKESSSRPVIFTSSGCRVCELPENLEVLCSLHI